VNDTGERGLYIVLISVHGLVRGTEPELGRDPDTGGQVRYVLELAKALAERDEVDRVELLTRQILSVDLPEDYTRHVEPLTDGAAIVRLPCGPHRYLRKESLWPHLPDFVDHTLQYFRASGRLPDVIHSHYADAGEVGRRLATLLDTPLIHTGHSLGRDKLRRLLDKGQARETIEKRYRISRRIEAEERVFEAADRIIASTEQEAEDQYGMYDTSVRSKIVVIPPGVDVSRFQPPRRGDATPPVADSIDRFLHRPKKPLILALQRPDERKNLSTLIHAYGGSPELQETANLSLLIGSRDDLSELERGQRKVLQEMLQLIDLYDLYGRVAYPKRHEPDDVPDIYRLAAQRHGVFVNPALTEPFGLTLIEAAASGLPVVATDDGGPQTILDRCRNGRLVDPLDADGIAAALLDVLSDRREWRKLARAGLRGVERNFTWSGHVDRYLREVRRLVRQRQRRASATLTSAMVLGDRLLVCDIDNTLLGDDAGLERLVATLETHRGELAFGIATGRPLPSALSVLRANGVPIPDVLITGVGSEIHYGGRRPVEDTAWRRTIDHAWDRDALQELLDDLQGLKLQSKPNQRRFKLSYDVEPDRAPSIDAIRDTIRSAGLEARVIFSHNAYLDILPARASKGDAVRFVAHRWGFPLSDVLVAGDSGNDEAMLTIGAKGVVVANHDPEIEHLGRRTDIHFADGHHAWGILEGIDHHGFVQAAHGDHIDDHEEDE
jgi:sucrose-phosphate synthase